MPELFTQAFEVRDYECDLQGIVNNAHYLHYLEHARHGMLKRVNTHFAKLIEAGVHLVVVRAEVDYKAPLRSGDAFVVESRLERVSIARFRFLQDIVRTTDGQRRLVARAVIVCAATDRAGRPMRLDAIEPLLTALGAGDVPA